MQRVVREPAAERRIERARKPDAPRRARGGACPAPASICVTARRKRAIPSALPPGDIRLHPMFVICSCFEPGRGESQAALPNARDAPLALFHPRSSSSQVGHHPGVEIVDRRAELELARCARPEISVLAEASRAAVLCALFLAVLLT